MAKKYSRIGESFRMAALAASAIFFASCDNPFASLRRSGAADILSGVFAWARQDWPASVSHFMDSLDHSEGPENSLVRNYALYGLGATYLSGDERRAAESRFDLIESDAPAEIAASVWYQRGIIAYRDGDYEAAARSFRRSMETGGVSTDARVNMELSLRSRDEAQSRSSEGTAATELETSADAAADSIFNLIRKKEQDRWKNQEAEKTEYSSPDY